jgi:hypothetical protein
VPKNPNAVALGRKGGKVRSERKRTASAITLALGRVKRQMRPEVREIMERLGCSRQWAYRVAERER